MQLAANVVLYAIVGATLIYVGRAYIINRKASKLEDEIHNENGDGR